MKYNEHNQEVAATDTKSAVFQRIQTEGITPKSKLAFIWTTWFARLILIMVIILGALAAATIVFTELSAGWEFYDATHDNMLTFFVASMPVAWVLILFGLLFLAYYQWRQCPCGYRWQCSHVLGVVLGGSVLLGIVFYAIGAGNAVDSVMGKHMPGYRPADEVRAHLWQAAETGRLSGYIVAASSSLMLTDMDRKQWQLVADTAQIARIESASGTRVRLIGRASTTDGVFTVCKVLPARVSAHDFKAMKERRDEYKDSLEYARSPAPLHDPCGKQRKNSSKF